MHFFITSSLLIICGIANAINGAPQNVESIPLNKFSQRFQRSLGLPYPYGSHYVYNPPIEPTLDNLDHVPDSRIDSYKPTYWPFRKSHPISHDIVPKSLPYRSIKSMQVPNTYDSEFYDTLDLPSLTSENNYNKYHAILNGYRKQQLSTMAEPNLAIQLLATTNIFHGYEVPTYQYPNNDESIVSNIVNKVPNTVFDRESQTYEMIPEVSKESPTVILLALSPETPEIQKNTNVAIEEKSPIFEITENESDITTTKTSLLNEEIKEILTLIEKLNATEVEETSNEDETLKTTVTTEKKLSENKLNVVPSLTSIVVSMYKNNAEEEKNTLDEEPQLTPIVEQRSPEMTLVENSAENEQNVLDKEPELTPLVELRSPEMVLIENLAEDEQNTQDEEPQLTPIVEQRSHEIELIENSTEEEQNTQSKEPQLTPIENQSLSEIVIVDNSTEKELMSTPENSITTTEDTSDINKSTFKLAEKQQIKIKDILQQYKELKPLFLTVDNISAEFPSNLSANKIEVEQAIAMYDENNEEER